MANLFKLTKRKKLKDFEKHDLINNKDVRNGCDESLLHNYCKHDVFDLDLLNAMLNAGYDINNINNRGHNMFQSCLIYCHDNKIKYKKIDWLLKNKIDLTNTKFDLTDFLLYEYPCTAEGHSFPTIITKEYFALIQQFYNSGLLHTDLQVEQYNHINLAYHCDNLDMFMWFEKHFKMNYDFDKIDYSKRGRAYEGYKNPLRRMVIHCEELSVVQVFEYVCSKCPNLLNHYLVLMGSPHDTLLSRILSQEPMSFYDFLPIAYKYGIQENYGEWNEFTQGLLNRCNYENKKKFIWGILNKKITYMPPSFVKAMALTINDFNDPETCSYLNGTLHEKKRDNTGKRYN